MKLIRAIDKIVRLQIGFQIVSQNKLLLIA